MKTGNTFKIKFLAVVMMTVTLFFAKNGWAQISLVSGNSWSHIHTNSTGGNPATTTTPYTVNPGSNRVLVVGVEVSVNAAGTVPSTNTVTWGGKPLTFVSTNPSAGNRVFAYLYYLRESDIATATGNDLTVTMGGATIYGFVTFAAVYEGVDQFTTVRNGANVISTTTTFTTATITANFETGDQGIMLAGFGLNSATATAYSSVSGGWTGSSSLFAGGTGNGGAFYGGIATRNSSSAASGESASMTITVAQRSSISIMSLMPLPGNSALGSIPIPAATVYAGNTRIPVQGFTISQSGGSEVLTSVDFSTTGTYTASDLVKFQLWTNTTNDFETSSQLGSDLTTSLGPGSRTFSGFTQTLTSGDTRYFWISMDVGNITSQKTLSVNGITNSSITVSGTKTGGPTTTGGLQTLSPTILAGPISSRFSVPGTYTFTVPEGVTSLTAQTWGGGGRGGSRTTGEDGTGGGGGGAFSQHTFPVTPGESYVVVVGSGSTSNANPGEDSWVSPDIAANALVLAKGGNSAPSNSLSGATGGSALSGVGSIRYSGGNGADRVSTTSSGGGGSSAGIGSSGSSASGITAGVAPTGGANGGNGRTSAGTGLAGQFPGGGGGGAVRSSGSPGGGSGGHGQVMMYYSYNVDAGPNQTQCANSVFSINTTTPPSGYTATWSVVAGSGTLSSNTRLSTSVTVPLGQSATVRLTITNGTITVTDDVVLTNANNCSTTCTSSLQNNGDLESSGSISAYNLSFQSTPAALINQNTNPEGWSGVYGSNVPSTSSFTGAYHIHKTGANGDPNSGSKYIYLAGAGFRLSGYKTGNTLLCGKKYRVRVWIAAFTNGTTQANSSFQMEVLSGGTNMPAINQVFSAVAPASTSWNNLNWQPYTFEVTVPANGYEWGDFVFSTMTSTNGIVIDDFCIEELHSGATADAGQDIQGCSNAFSMTANVPPTDYTGTWSVLSGNATITNPASPVTNVSLTSGAQARLRWTMTENAGNTSFVAINPQNEGGFENCCTLADNGWTVVNSTTNQWHVGSVSNPTSGSRAAYISNNLGTSFAYTMTSSQTSHFYRQVSVHPDATNITLSFKWKNQGDNGFDRLLVYTAPTSVTPVAGTPASNSTTLSGATLVSNTNLHSSANYQTATISLPNNLAGTTFRLIFTWQNNASAGTGSPCSVDEISLVYNLPACTHGDDVNIAYVTGANFSVTNDTICPIEMATLQAINCSGGQIAWSTGETTGSISVDPLETTQYTVSCTPNASVNRVSNPGYESATNLQFWENWANASITTTAAHVYAGTKAVFINTIGQNWGAVAQGFTATPGNRYQVRVYAKSSNTNVIPQLKYQFYQNTTLLEESCGPRVTSTNYQLYEYQIVAPPNTTRLVVFAEIGAGGELYLDNWDVAEFSQCVQVQTATVVVGEVNKIKNHELDNNLNHWNLVVQNGNSATLSQDNTSQLSGINSARVNISAASGTDSDIQLIQNGISLEAGKIYEISFRARASANRTTRAMLDLGQSPWTSYFSQQVNLTTNEQVYTFTYNQVAATSSGRVSFNLGAAAGTVWIDSITFKERCILFEICNNGIDDNLNGLVDCLDSGCDAETDNTLELNFESALPPTLVSGADKTKGAVYRFSNIASGVDALVTIDSVHNVLVFEEIFQVGLSHRIRGVPSNTPFVDYSVQLVQAGTSTPINPVDLVLSTLDIDGLNDPTKPYTDFITYKGINEVYALSQNTFLDAVKAGNEDYRFEVIPSGMTYPEDPTETNPDYGVVVVYDAVNSFQFRMGIKGSYAINDSRVMKVSGRKTDLQGFSFVSCTHVEICGNNIDDDNDGLTDCDDLDCACCHLYQPVIEGEDHVCSGENSSIELSVNSGQSFSWSSGESTQSITVAPLIQTTYTVTATNDRGCEKILQKTIDVQDCGGSICFFGNNEVSADVKWTIVYDTDPALNRVRIRTTFSKNFVDNTYGTNSIGWGGGHTFSQLVGSDHLIISLFDAANIKKMEIKMDYITASTAAPSGYKCLGVTGGEGSVLLGNVSDVINVETSLDRNFNTYGYVLTANSPVTNSNYDPDPLYPSWIYEVWYEAEIKLSAFGAAGFGTVDITGIHASPSKTGNNTELVDPGNCCVLEPVITGDTLVCPGANTTLGVNLLVNTSAQLDASDDTFLAAENPGENHGACNEIAIGLRNNFIKRGLVKFNLQDIPPGATIVAANLLLQKKEGSTVAVPVSVHAVNGAWTENNGGCGGNNLSPNWNYRNTSSLWSTAGGSFGPEIASTIVSANGFYSWNVLSTVQSWISNPSSNHGFLLKTNELANNEYVFYSSEEGTASRRPSLQVVYLAPPANVSYTWSNGATTETTQVNPYTTTTYTVTVTAPGTCDMAAAQKTVKVMTLNDASTQSICPGSGTNLSVNISGDSGPFTYAWSPPTGLSSTTSPTPYASPSVPTTYTVTVTGTNGCTATTTRTIDIRPPVNADVTGPSVLCPGSTATLEASGGLAYLWNTGSFDSSIIVNSAGTYQVTVTDITNCTAVVSKTVGMNPPLNVLVDIIGDICVTENTQLFASVTGGAGGYTFIWSGPGGFTGNTQTVNVTNSGNYYVTVTDASGCSGTGTTYLYQQYEPYIVSLNPSICEGDSITLNVSSASAVSYQWSANADHATTSEVMLLPTVPASSYQVTVTNDLGCTAVPEVSIEVHPRPVVNITGLDEICVGDTTSVFPHSGGNWTSTHPEVAYISDNGIIIGTGGGVATFIFTEGEYGCSSLATAPVEIKPRPEIEITGPTEICVGDTTFVLPSAGGVWESSDMSVASVDNQGSIVAVGPGTATFTFTSDSTLCPSDASGTITIQAPPIVYISGVDGVCLGTNIMYTSNYPGGVWSSSNPDVATVNNSGVITTIDVGQVTIFYQYTSGVCAGIVSKTLSVYEIPVVQYAGTDVLCQGQTTQITPSTNGTWITSNPNVATITNQGVVTAISAGYAAFTFVNDTTGCVSEPSGTLTVYAKPVISLNGPSGLCLGTTTNFLPFSGGTWTSLNPFVATISQNGLVTSVGAGSANFIFTHEMTGCVSDTSITVQVGTSPSASIDYHGSICLTDNSQLSAVATGGNPPYTYQWVGPLGFTSTAETISITNNGSYFTTITDSYGCKANISGFVYQRFDPVIINTNSNICEGRSVNLSVNASSATSYQWSSNAGSATTSAVTVFPAFPSSTYQVSVTNSIGCLAVASATVTVKQKPVVQITGPSTLCTGQTSNLSPSTGGTWASLNPTIASVTNAGLVTAINAGTSRFLFTSSTSGCVSDTLGTITIHSRSPISLAGPSTICVGTQTQLNPTSGGAWTSLQPAIAVVSASGLVTGMSQGIAQFSFTNTAGCTSNGTLSVTVNSKPAIVLNGPGQICVGATTQFLPSSGGNWSSSHPLVATITSTGNVNGLYPGSARFVFTNSSTGCKSDSSAIITVSASTPVSVTGPSSICVGTTTTLSPATGGTWVSSNPAVASVTNAGIVTGLSTGTATFTFINSTSGCISQPTTAVTINPRPVVSVTGPNGICLGATTTLSPTSGGSWTSSSVSIATVTSGGIVTGISAGLVHFTFTSATTGCVSLPTSNVTVYAKPAVSSSSTTICIGSSTNLQPSTGGTWMSLNPSVATVSNAGVVTGLTPGTVQFVFTNSTTGCSSDPTVVHTVSTKPVTSVTGSSEICQGFTTQLNPTSGGSWISLNPSVASVTNGGVVTGLANGTASFVFTTNQGCSSDPTQQVTINGKPSVSYTGPTSICIGSTTQLSPSSEGTWISSRPHVATVTSSGLVTGISSGLARFVYTKTSTGCKSDSTAFVTVNSLPIVSLLGPSTICIGQTSQLTPTAGGTWISLTPAVASVSNGGLVTGVGPGTASFKFIQSNTGCETNFMSPVTVLSRPSTTLVGPGSICIGSSTQLTPNAGGTWTSLNPSVATIDNAGIVTAVGQGVTSFVFTSQSTGCSSANSVPVTVLARPGTSLIGRSAICVNDNSQLLPNSGGTWASSNPAIATITNTGLITGITAGNTSFIFTDASTGCASDATVNVTVLPPATLSVTGDNQVCLGFNTTLSSSSSGIWYSTRPDVAKTTSNGLVTGTAPGKVSFYFVESITGCTTYMPADAITVENCIDPDFNVTMARVPLTGNVRTNDEVPDGTSYPGTIFLVSKPLGSVATISINSTGQYQFEADMAGTYVYEVMVCLPSYGPNCPVSRLSIQVINPNTESHNVIPNLDIMYVSENQSVTIPTTENDKCIAGLSCSIDPTRISILTVPKRGTASLLPSGQIVYTPNPGFAGLDTLRYQVCASNNPANCRSALQIITIMASNANRAISAGDDFQFLSKGQSSSIINVMANDKDSGNGALLVTPQGNMTAPESIPAGTYYVTGAGAIHFTPNITFTGPVDIAYEVCNGNGDCVSATAHFLVLENLKLRVRAYLEGALMENQNQKAPDNRPLMRDNLRMSPFTGSNYIPATDPYSTPTQHFDISGAYQHEGSGGQSLYTAISNPAQVFSITGQNAIVDWVFLELRSKTDNTFVLATRSALIQRDGDIVDLDGVSPVEIPDVRLDSCYVVLKHRNHFGVMSGLVSTADILDFTSPQTPTFDFGTSLNDGYNYTGLAQKADVINGYMALWAGNFDSNGRIKFVNPDDDQNILFFEVLSYPSNAEFMANYNFSYGYLQGDYDLNSKSKYDNPDDDKNMLFYQVLFHPLNESFISNFNFIRQQIPDRR